MQHTIISIPDECAKRKGVCVFNLGSGGHCLCYEHYHVRDCNSSTAKAYYAKYPERRRNHIAK